MKNITREIKRQYLQTLSNMGEDRREDLKFALLIVAVMIVGKLIF